MSDFIAEQRRSIKARLHEVDDQLCGWDDLRAEKLRLEAALVALGEPVGDRLPSRRSLRPAPKRQARRKGIGERIVGFVGERPGATVDAIADGIGEEKRIVYRNAYSLSTRGKLEREKLPGGQTGFKVPS